MNMHHLLLLALLTNIDSVFPWGVLTNTNTTPSSAPGAARPRIKWDFTTAAYQKEALDVIIGEANCVAKELGLHETLPITKSNLTSVAIAPPLMTMFGTITTSNYLYGAGLLKKFSTLDAVNQQRDFFEARKNYYWPIARRDTNAAIATAREVLQKLRIDVRRLDRDYAVKVYPSSGLGSHFVPIYRVDWVTDEEEIAAVEFLEPTRTIRHIHIDDAKYILRTPLTTSNLRETMIEGGASDSLLKRMGLAPRKAEGGSISNSVTSSGKSER
jgi:hypothetical protein